ncbi:MAG TPA: hypothetical protein VKY81_00275 [Natronosporangium sp.]|nr:hypothetical protein [Natronosporangium sp.]
MAEASDNLYQARYGITRLEFFFLLVCALLAALPIAGLFQATNAEQFTIAALAAGFLVLVIVYRVVMWAYRRVAFRVDATGVTLGTAPPRSAKHIAFVPWSDVRRIVLWRMPVNRTTVRYIGVDRMAGAPPLPGSARNAAWRKLNAAVAPGHVPEHVVADSRPITGWRLDEKRLARAVSHFAPHVEIVDLR